MRENFGATAIERVGRARDVFSAVLSKSLANRPDRVHFGAEPPDVGNPDKPPHGDDLWISTDEAENYATYLDGKINQLHDWLSMGEEPEDLAKFIGTKNATQFFITATNFFAWEQKWDMAHYQMRELTQFNNSWDQLVQYHRELKAYADEFKALLKPLEGEVVPPPEVPPPPDGPKTGPGKDTEETDIVTIGAVALGALGLFLLLKK